MRKAFNFYRSFYDTFNQIRRPDDRLIFITALLEKQFENIDPEGLKDIPLFAYESQRQVIESQVQGYIDKTGEQPTPKKGGSQGGTKGRHKGGSVQGKEKEKEQEKESPALDKKVEVVINYLNDKTGKSFKASSKHNQKLIAGRLSDGHGWRDFKDVIDNRVTNWGNDPKMKEFLRPETLFRPTNFENYLVEARAQRPQRTSAKKPADLDRLFGEKSEVES